MGGGTPPALRRRERRCLETHQRLFDALIAEFKRAGSHGP